MTSETKFIALDNPSELRKGLRGEKQNKQLRSHSVQLTASAESPLEQPCQCPADHSPLHALRDGGLRLADVRVPQHPPAVPGGLHALLLPAVLLLQQPAGLTGGQLLLLQHGCRQTGQTQHKDLLFRLTTAKSN